MHLYGLVQLVGLAVILTTYQEQSAAESMTSLTSKIVKGTEEGLGTHVISVEGSETEGYTLGDDNGVSSTPSSEGGGNLMLWEQPDQEWSIVTVVSSDLDYGGDTDDGDSNAISWSWFPIQWTWVIIAELVVGIIGIVGNLLVIIVLFQRRAKSRSTDTLIGALAVADLMTSVGLLPTPPPRSVPSTWLAQVYCRAIWLPIYMWSWAFMSGFVLTAISVERYIAVTHPIYFYRILTRRRVSEVVICLWITAVIACFPAVWVTDVNKDNHRCTVATMSPSAQTAFAAYVTFIQLLLPTTVMVITQTLIAVKLHRQSKCFENSKSYHLAASRAVVKMMLIVIVVYIICWTPNRFFFLVTSVLRVHGVHTKVKSQISESFIVLAAVNSSINPIIYSARYGEFRQAVKALFVGGTVRNKAMFDEEMKVDTRSSKDDTLRGDA